MILKNETLPEREKSPNLSKIKLGLVKCATIDQDSNKECGNKAASIHRIFVRSYNDMVFDDGFLVDVPLCEKCRKKYLENGD